MTRQMPPTAHDAFATADLRRLGNGLINVDTNGTYQNMKAEPILSVYFFKSASGRFGNG